EHLQDYTIESRDLSCCQSGGIAGEACRCKNSQLAVAEVIDRGIGEDTLQVFLREGRKSGKNYRADGKPQERRQHRSNLWGKDGKNDSKEPVDTHFGHCAGEQHSRAGWRFDVCRRQPCMKRNERDFNGEAEKCTTKNQECDLFRRKPVPGEMCSHCRDKLAVSRQFRQAQEIECSGAMKQSKKREQQRDASGHGVNKKLRRCGCALRSAPQLDEEEGRDEA